MFNPKDWASILAGVALGVVVPTSSALADSAAYKQLSGDWWQWVLSIPTPSNPLLDPTGGYCMVGQRGETWFLVGTFSGGPASRTCSVPEGVPLFFPVINSIAFDTPNCFQGPDPIPARDWRDVAAWFIDNAANVWAQVDNLPVGPLHRVQSKVFHVALPDDNVFAISPSQECPGGLRAGVYAPAVDDGIYVRLEPLAAGMHTLQLHAENPTAGFVLDVTYNLHVVPVLLK